MLWNKDKDLDKFVWVNQVVLFLQSLCFMIEILEFQVINIKLCRSREYCSFLTHFGSVLLFMLSDNINNLWFSDVFKQYKKVTFTSAGLILVVQRNYNVLQSFSFGNYWLGKSAFISKIWSFEFHIFILIFATLYFQSLGTRW